MLNSFVLIESERKIKLFIIAGSIIVTVLLVEIGGKGARGLVRNGVTEYPVFIALKAISRVEVEVV